MEYHSPLESFWNRLYYKSKQHTYRTASTAAENSTTIKDVLDTAFQEHNLRNSIAKAITQNELSSTNTYTDEQIALAIKQKYYPQASNTQISLVLEALENDVTKIATETKFTRPQPMVKLYTSWDYYDHIHGMTTTTNLHLGIDSNNILY